MGLVSVVVIPARDEEEHIGACLEALAAQTVGVDAFETIVVLDHCVDRTEAVARERAAALGLSLTVLQSPRNGAGSARRAGLDAAAERLFDLHRADGLIACTDADTRPAPDWLARQLAHVQGGAQVIAGLIELDPSEAEQLPSPVLRRRERDAAERLARVHRESPGAEHHHFAGASLGMTAAVYRRVGGIEPVPAREDAVFAKRLAKQGVDVLRASDVRVLTSARSVGRTPRGLSVDVAVSSWAARRRYRADDFPPERLAEHKRGQRVSVVIPTKECAETIGGVLMRTVAPASDQGLIDELVVVDAASEDGTAEIAAAAGAQVIQQDEVLARFGPALGKGDAMWRAVSATTGEIVCFLDGDTLNPAAGHLLGLLGPLLTEPSVALVKGAFDRPLVSGGVERPHEGGRVTELMARPLLNLREPLLAGFAQPLAGEFAGRRAALEQSRFPVGYGVEIAVLIDVLRAHGLDALAECHLGTRHNRHQPLRALGEMAYAVLVAVEHRSEHADGPPGGHYMRPWDDFAVSEVPVDERPPLASLAGSAERVAG
ncbi:MAG TPA: glucosyl-3-phosphoglycerate synthase [Solirubrobacteraceae bacterium]